MRTAKKAIQSRCPRGAPQMVGDVEQMGLRMGPLESVGWCYSTLSMSVRLEMLFLVLVVLKLSGRLKLLSGVVWGCQMGEVVREAFFLPVGL